ncbi:MAG: hypothetical protein JO034_12945 [Singulisphaera sp.]|nr:hypothetical protein [Singulisphaera sp.]
MLLLTSLRPPEEASALEAGDRSGPRTEARPAGAAPRAQEPRHGVPGPRDDDHVGAAGPALEAATPAEQAARPGRRPRPTRRHGPPPPPAPGRSIRHPG